MMNYLIFRNQRENDKIYNERDEVDEVEEDKCRGDEAEDACRLVEDLAELLGHELGVLGDHGEQLSLDLGSRLRSNELS